MKRPAKRRLDVLLVERELATDLREARGLVMGGKVVVEGVVCAQAGTAYRPDVEIHVRGRRLKFASRGGYKLEAALVGFGVDVCGRVALDAGASTGGFTDCLLQRGAAHVYAVDVGFGQLRGRLAADPRVTNLERTNIGDVDRSRLDPPIDLVVGDLSNLSLATAVPILGRLFGAVPVELVVLVKPLFEGVERSAMADPGGLAAGLAALLGALEASGYGAVGLMASPVRGGRSSVEFLAHLRKGPGAEAGAMVAAAVADIPDESTE